MGFQLFGIFFGFAAAVFIQLRPKCLAVVHVPDVAEFVQQDVVLKMFGKEGNINIQADVVLI
jgi:hypothetical protein